MTPTQTATINLGWLIKLRWGALAGQIVTILVVNRAMGIVKWEHINRVLSDCGGNVSEASRRLRVHRRTSQRILQRYPPPR